MSLFEILHELIDHAGFHPNRAAELHEHVEALGNPAEDEPATETPTDGAAGA